MGHLPQESYSAQLRACVGVIPHNRGHGCAKKTKLALVELRSIAGFLLDLAMILAKWTATNSGYILTTGESAQVVIEKLIC